MNTNNVLELYEQNKNLLEEAYKAKGFKSSVYNMIIAVLEFGLIKADELYKKLERLIKKLIKQIEVESEEVEQKENPKHLTTINGKVFNKKEKNKRCSRKN